MITEETKIKDVIPESYEYNPNGKFIHDKSCLYNREQFII